MGFLFNSTFIIQMLHFYGAYLLFYYILFKPALIIIQKEKESKAQLAASIEQSRLQLEEYKQRQRHHWLAARNYFRDNIPAVIAEYERMQSLHGMQDLAISGEDIDHQITVLTDALVHSLEKQ